MHIAIPLRPIAAGTAQPKKVDCSDPANPSNQAPRQQHLLGLANPPRILTDANSSRSPNPKPRLEGPIGITTTGIPLYNAWASPPPQHEEAEIYKYTKLPGTPTKTPNPPLYHCCTAMTGSAMAGRARQLYSLDPVFARTFDSLGGVRGKEGSQATIS